jgi:sensor histidine kinase regulating citrate/malate metabolism
LQAIVIERVIRNVILFFVMGFSAYYMILKLFQQTRRQISMQQEENLLRLQIAEAKVHFESLKEVNESISICKHDMRHHLNLIHSYLADDNRDAARKYIAGIQDTIEAAAGNQYCSNYTVNLILSSYIGIAKESLIKVTCHLQLPASDRISDMDLCVIFANAIENATHACLDLQDPKERWIRIDTKTVGQQIRIQIHNSFSGKTEFAGGIPVNREEGHGMGVKSIIAVVEKYGGLCDFSVQDNVFKVSIIL